MPSLKETTKALLERHGIRPRKTWGQNFMVDPNFARAIARAAAPDKHKLMLEIGPGAGALTRALLDADAHTQIIAVEVDPRMIQVLQDEFAEEIDRGRLTLIACDALSGKHALNDQWVSAFMAQSRNTQRPHRVLCANLPYQIAAPLIANLATSDGAEAICEKLIVTIQLELAERLLGQPDSKAYGPLAAYLHLRAEGKILRRIGPEAFWPRPKVSSAVLELRLRPWDEIPFPPHQARPFMDFLQRVFQNRRKTLRATLRASLPRNDPRGTTRAETLPPMTLLELHRSCDGG